MADCQMNLDNGLAPRPLAPDPTIFMTSQLPAPGPRGRGHDPAFFEINRK